MQQRKRCVRSWKDLRVVKNKQQEVDMAREINPGYRYTRDIEHLCETLKTMGHFKVYGDTLSAKLLFYPRDPFRTEIAADFATDCLRKVGFTNVETHKENDKFTCAAHATINCEYDLGQHRVKSANIQDIQALSDMFNFMIVWCKIFVEKEPEVKELPYWEYKAGIQKYLREHSKGK